LAHGGGGDRGGKSDETIKTKQNKTQIHVLKNSKYSVKDFAHAMRTAEQAYILQQARNKACWFTQIRYMTNSIFLSIALMNERLFENGADLFKVNLPADSTWSGLWS
jgi:hypothetical protein